MIERVKLALRVNSNHFDGEIEDLIASAKDDLVYSGVKAEKVEGLELDPLIVRAIKTYCKANFGYDNPDAERFARSYDMLKQHLSLSNEYRVGDEGEA